MALVILVFSCEKTNDLDDFFLSLKNKIGEEKISKFKDTPLDSVLYSFDTFSEEYRQAFSAEIHDAPKLFTKIKNFNTGEYVIPPYVYVIYEFHSWLNGKNFSIEYYEDIYSIHKKAEAIREQREAKILDRQLLNMILKSKSECRIGDTLELSFPISTRHYGRVATERKYPYSLEFPPGTDTLIMKGILLNKLLDSVHLKFELEVTDLNEDDVSIYEMQYAVGDTIYIPLHIYGRPIKSDVLSPPAARRMQE